MFPHDIFPCLQLFLTYSRSFPIFYEYVSIISHTYCSIMIRTCLDFSPYFPICFPHVSTCLPYFLIYFLHIMCIDFARVSPHLWISRFSHSFPSCPAKLPPVPSRFAAWRCDQCCWSRSLWWIGAAGGADPCHGVVVSTFWVKAVVNAFGYWGFRAWIFPHILMAIRKQFYDDIEVIVCNSKI